MKCNGRLTRDDRGYSVLEAAITVPAMFLLAMIVVQWAIVWHARNVVQSAARQGLRSAEGYQSSATTGRNDAEHFLEQVAPNALTNTAVIVDRSTTTVTVTVRARVKSVIPFGTYTVSASASGPVERYVPVP